MTSFSAMAGQTKAGRQQVIPLLRGLMKTLRQETRNTISLRSTGIAWWRVLQLLFLKFVCVLAYARGLYEADAAAQQQSKPVNAACVEAAPARSIHPDANTSKGAVVVAVVVPVYVRDKSDARSVVGLLEALTQQTLQPSVLVLVDDASPLRWWERNGVTLMDPNNNVVLLFHQRNRGPAAARNSGLVRARDEHGASIVCFTDVDCRPQRGWVEAMVAAHLHSNQTDKVMIAGMTVSAGDSIIGEYHDFYGTLNARTDPFGNNTILYGPTCNLSISLPPHIPSIPLFDERYREASWEDIEWCVRLRVHGGYIIALCVHAVIEHEFNASVRGLFHMFRKYGRWQEITFDLHPALREEFGRSQHVSGGAD